MEKTLAEIADIVEGEVVGDKNLIITGLSGIQEAKQGDLTFAANSKYILLTKKTKASAIITSRDVEIPGKSIIRTDNPSLAFANIASMISEQNTSSITGIHPSAVIAEDADIAEGVAIGPHVVIEVKAKIGKNSIINSGSLIGSEAELGEDCLIQPNVTIMSRSQIGSRVIIHSTTVIGSDGFGYEYVEGKHQKIPQTGIVVIGDDVEVGAGVTIDRARFGKTVIGKGTKIDNLVQIAHNVEIGENCIIVSQVGISGSVAVGENSILAGQAGVAEHLTIGEGSVVAGRAGVTKSLPPNSKVSGYPAKDHEHAKKVNACLQRLPLYVKMIQELKKKLELLEEKFKSGK